MKVSQAWAEQVTPGSQPSWSGDIHPGPLTCQLVSDPVFCCRNTSDCHWFESDSEQWPLPAVLHHLEHSSKDECPEDVDDDDRGDEVVVVVVVPADTTRDPLHWCQYCVRLITRRISVLTTYNLFYTFLSLWSDQWQILLKCPGENEEETICKLNDVCNKTRFII